MTARILTIHRANVEIDGRLYRFIRKTCSRTVSSLSGAEPADAELVPQVSAGRLQERR